MTIDPADLRLVLRFAAIGKYCLATSPRLREKWPTAGAEVGKATLAWDRLWREVYDDDGNPKPKTKER